MRQINPVNNNGSIRIRFSLKGQTYSFNPVMGGEYKNANDMKAAMAVATQIEGDIRTGNFDPTLAKYGHTKPIQAGIDQAQADLKELRDKRTAIALWDLWERYAKFKKPLVAPSTFKVDFCRRMNWLRGKDYRVTDAIAVRDLLICTKPVNQARKILTQLAAACRWGIESGLIETNPFEGMARNLTTRKDKDGEINPFTPQEKLAVIAAFENHADYSFYTPLVRFMFATGCRPSEAIAVEWGDLKGDRLTFQRTYSEGEVSPRLKTQKKRVVKLNPEAIAVVGGQGKDGPLIFPSPNGKKIDWHNFANRAWKAVLLSLPEIGYRNPKQMKHTFVTERILAGDSPVNVGRYVGTSPATIYKHYLGASREYSPG